MKQKILILLFATLVGTSLTQASVVIDGIAYVINETKNVAAVTSGGTYTGEVVIPSTVTYEDKTYSVVSIGNSAFSDCTDLTLVTIPNSVTSIGTAAFYKCRSLTSVTIPNSVTTIGNSAFSYCSKLTSITIPNSVTSIGEFTFDHCSELTSITIPNSVTNIGYCAFQGCSKLTQVDISDLTAWCNIDYCLNSTYIDESTNPLCYAHHLYLNGTEITNLVIPDDVKTIKLYAFYGCTGITSLSIPNSVKSIGRYAFGGCKGITSITIPNGVTSIKREAFYYCSGITSLTIPSSVTSIEQEAFANCGNLIEIYDYRETPQSISTGVFEGVEKTICTLYVPYKAVSAYQNADGWKEFKDIVPFGFNTFTITTAATNGTVTGGGLYAEGSTATLNATPNTGYRFTQWSDGNTDNPRTVTVSEDQKYTAMFVKVAFTVNVNQNCSITVQ